jgi:site-specific recombinase XerD
MKIKDVGFYNRVRDFIDVYIVKQKKFSPNTQKAYRESLSLLLDFFEETQGLPYEKIGFDDITQKSISDFLDWIEKERGCSKVTANHRLMAIKSFLKYCAAIDPSKIAVRAAVKNVPMRKVQQKIVDFLSDRAMKVLIDQIDETSRTGLRDKMFILLMYDLGARCQELIDTKLCHIDLRKTEPQVKLHRKGDKIQCLPISPEIFAILKRYLEKYHPIETRSSDDYLFYTTSHGLRNQISPDAVSLFLCKYAAKAHAVCSEVPEKVRPHQLRHSRAMHLYRNGIPQVLLSEFLGHKDPVTTKVYAWSDVEMKRKAIAKANPVPIENVEDEIPVWKNNKEIIKKLYGLS